MSKKSTIVVAFPRGGIIPASVLDASEDYTAPPHKPVEVPKAYGEHLITDRLAYDVLEADKRRKAQAETAAQSAASSDTDKAELDRLKTDNTKLSDDLTKLQLSLKTATDTIAQLEADKIKLSGEAGELQRDLDEVHQLLKTERENVLSLTEQLSEATKPPVQQQESLKMDGDTGKSK